jgi:hypothetical protein
LGIWGRDKSVVAAVYPRAYVQCVCMSYGYVGYGWEKVAVGYNS